MRNDLHSWLREKPNPRDRQCRALTKKGRRCQRRTVVPHLVCLEHINDDWGFVDWLGVYSYIHTYPPPDILNAMWKMWADIEIRCPVRQPYAHATAFELTISPRMMDTWLPKETMSVVVGEPRIEITTTQSREVACLASELLVHTDQAISLGLLSDEEIIRKLHRLAAEAAQIQVGKTLAGLSFTSWKDDL